MVATVAASATSPFPGLSYREADFSPFMGRALVLLGPNGSGKSCQGKEIAKRLRLKRFLDCSVELDRHFLEEARPYKARRELVPDELVKRAMQLSLMEFQGRGVACMGAYPRSCTQRHDLDQITLVENQVVIVYLTDVDRMLESIRYRRVCDRCKHEYNLRQYPQSLEGCIQMRCGGRLIQRDEDKPKNATPRFHEEMDRLKAVLETCGDRIVHCIHAKIGWKGVWGATERILMQHKFI